MPEELEAYIIRQNIELYCRRLAAATDVSQRRTLLMLLFDEQEKQRRLTALRPDLTKPTSV